MQMTKPVRKSHILPHNPVMLKLAIAFLGHYGKITKFPEAKSFFQHTN